MAPRSVVPPEAEFDIYVNERGSKRKPRKVGTHPADKRVPAEIVIDGKPYYFVSADLSERWLSYGDNRGNVTN